MSRARELGAALGKVGGSAAGGLVPAFAMDYAYEFDTFKENWYAYPLVMAIIGGLLAWKGLDWMKPVGYGMIGAAFFSGYRNYKDEASGAGNVMWRDAGNVLPAGYQDAGALPAGNPYRTAYYHATTTYPYATA